MGILNLISLWGCCNSNCCSWPAWPWIQRHYNPTKCCKLLAQQHGITILQTGIYPIRDSWWPRISRSHVWDVTACNLTGADVWGEGITSICTADPDYTPSHPSRLYAVLFQPYYQYGLMLASFLLWYRYVCLQSITLLRGFTCFWHTFIITTCPCIFSSPL